MNAFVQLGAVTVVAVLIQLLFPGRDFYHYGWFNVALAAVLVLALLPLRKVLAKTPPRARAGVLLSALGITLIGIAGLANGLLAPDPQTVVGAPGASVRIDELGRALDFPLVENGMKNFPASRISGSFLLRAVPRSVVQIDVADARGAHLTITQPSGSAFLSPVLLMQSQQTIAGMNLPYDSFAVPAAHRMVKAVLFDAQQAAQLHGVGPSGGPAVLFDVEDDAERPMPGGIALARDGQTISVAGLRLTPAVLSYPAVEILAIPNVVVIAFGLLLIAAGVVLARSGVRTPSYS